jgi:hypothetical protein
VVNGQPVCYSIRGLYDRAYESIVGAKAGLTHIHTHRAQPGEELFNRQEV